jgi:hypothetical protein
VLLHLERFKQQNDTLFSVESFQKMNHLGQILREKISGDDKSAIDQAMHELNSFTRPLAELAMDHAVAAALKGKKPV